MSPAKFSRFMRIRTGAATFDSPIPSIDRASCSDSRVPASSTCTRTFISNGTRGFSVFSNFPNASGNASNS